ncbi:MAG: hypothetical protein QM809_08155 [Gordonia sp. (in: high G+C Gram-positive bacteria)]|uniref:hypothetical protein n=1 Tax=Gordonia sp. (in: high G+C Gram-positive bacteria) TaxID=84139 RepID=UPI0039E5CECB
MPIARSAFFPALHHRFASSGAELSPERTRSRIGAYVYGNVLLLAALVPLTPKYIADGHAVTIVLGTGVTTFLAHMFAEFVAQAVTVGGRPSEPMREEFRESLRDSLPIVSSATVPALSVFLGWLNVLPGGWALGIAGTVIVVRLAALPLMAERLRGRPVTSRVLIGSVLVTVLAAVVVILKVVLTH